MLRRNAGLSRHVHCKACENPTEMTNFLYARLCQQDGQTA